VIAIGDRPSATPAALGRGGDPLTPITGSSTRLDHSWHTGQRPSHLVSACPHDWQRQIERPGLTAARGLATPLHTSPV